MTRSPRTSAVIYLGLMTLVIYGVANRAETAADGLLLPLLVVAQLAVGLAVGRWWALVLPGIVVLISVPAGYPPITPDNAEPLPIWFGLMYGAVFALPLVAVGVLSRKVYKRRGRAGFS